MINFNEDGLAAYLEQDPGGPVVMLNLLRFQPIDGRETYMSYTEHFGSSGINEKYGLEVLFVAPGSTALVAEPGQEWDMVVLVRYPSRQHFVDMVHDPLYQRFEHLRTDSLLASVLQATVPL